MATQINGKAKSLVMLVSVLTGFVICLTTYVLTSKGAASKEQVFENTKEIGCVKEDIREIKTDVRWIREKLEE